MIYESHRFSLDTKLYSLKRNGESVSVEPQVFDLLIYLIEHRNRVVTRDELLDKLWHGRIVTDSAINARLKETRKAVGDSGSKQAVIRTIHGRGYQFIDDIKVIGSKDVVANSDSELDEQDYRQLPDKPVIAVLQFANISNDPDQAYFSDGITKNIYSGLSRIRSLIVKSELIHNYKNKSIGEIAQEFDLCYLLTGAVQKEEDHVRVFAELIDCDSGEVKWSQRYDRQGKKVIDIQDDIASAIIATVSSYRGKINEIELEYLSTKTTDHFNVYDFVLKGIAYKDRYTLEDSKKSHYYFDRAKSLDPENSEALGWSAWAHLMDVYMGWSDDSEKSLKTAYKQARKAISLDHFSEVGHWALAASFSIDRKTDRAIESFDKALDINPNNPDIMVSKGVTLSESGQTKQGIEHILKGMKFNNHFPEWYLWELGAAYFCNNQFEEAIKSFNQMNNQNIDSRIYLAASYALCGNLKEASHQAEEIYRINPGFKFEQVSVSHSRLLEKVLGNLMYGLQLAFNSSLEQQHPIH